MNEAALGASQCARHAQRDASLTGVMLRDVRCCMNGSIAACKALPRTGKPGGPLDR
jgi:hypothetical protein